MNAKKRIPGKPFLRLANPLLEDLEGKIWERWQDLALVLCLKAEGEYRAIRDVKGDHAYFYENGKITRVEDPE